MTADAILSEDRVYRYALWRIWNPEAAPVLFVGLNPSTADETQDDATIRRCVGFARGWGYGGLLMGNLFAFRATDPAELKDDGSDKIGPENDKWLLRMGLKADRIVLAWGASPFAAGGLTYVCLLWPGRALYCLGKTQNGSPKHPLRLLKATVPVLI